MESLAQTYVIYGVHPVMEALRGGKQLDRVLLRQGMEGPLQRELQALAQEHQVPVQYVPQEKLARLCKGGVHQGVAAMVASIDYVSLEDAVEEALMREEAPLVLLLDGVSDVRNFGAIARTAECAGVRAVIVPAKGGAAANAEAVKSSAGALLRMDIVRTPNLRTALYYLKGSGFQVVAATEKASGLLYGCDFSCPTAIVMGAEGHGISSGVLTLCDKQLRIPLRGDIASLNVSAAAAVVLFEAVRQRQKDQE